MRKIYEWFWWAHTFSVFAHTHTHAHTNAFSGWEKFPMCMQWKGDRKRKVKGRTVAQFFIVAFPGCVRVFVCACVMCLCVIKHSLYFVFTQFFSHLVSHSQCQRYAFLLINNRWLSWVQVWGHIYFARSRYPIIHCEPNEFDANVRANER